MVVNKEFERKQWNCTAHPKSELIAGLSNEADGITPRPAYFKQHFFT
jgi:hypothetical protein